MLAVDAKKPSALLAHQAGYIDRENEVIVGLQTDEPFKRAIFPSGGLRMVEAGLKAAGFEIDSRVQEAFTKYRAVRSIRAPRAKPSELWCETAIRSPISPGTHHTAPGN